MPASSSSLRRLASEVLSVSVVLTIIALVYSFWLDRESTGSHSRVAVRDSAEHVLILKAVTANPPLVEQSAAPSDTDSVVDNDEADASAAASISATTHRRTVQSPSVQSIQADAQDALTAAIQVADARALGFSAEEDFPISNFVAVANVSPRHARIAADAAARMLQEALADVADMQSIQSTAPREQLAIQGTIFGLRRHIALLRNALIEVDRAAAYRTLAQRAEVLLAAA